MSDPLLLDQDTRVDPAPTRASAAGPRRALMAILLSQLLLGALLVIGDLRSAGPALPSIPFLQPSAPSLDTPTRPGDQTRRFSPNQPGLTPGRDTPFPDRLTLTESSAETWPLEGAIAPGDADRIIRQLTLATTRPRVLRLNSPGGSVSDALTLGRWLRAEGFATEITARAICLSACPYILAAGTTRIADPQGQVGVHQHFFGQSTLLPAFIAVEDIQRGQGEVMAYLDQMGIDPLLMQHSLTTPPDEIYILSEDQLKDYKLISP